MIQSIVYQLRLEFIILSSKPALHQQISTIFSRVMHQYGYKLVDTPIVEDANLFQTRAGDAIIERLIAFSHQNRELALRPEFTASLVQRYLRSEQDIARWQYHGYVFEQQRNGATAYQQSYNIGVELIGMEGTIAVAETISLAIASLEALGVENYQLRIGHVGLLKQLMKRFQLDRRTTQLILSYRQSLKNSIVSIDDVLAEIYDIIPHVKENNPSELNSNQIAEVVTANLLNNQRYRQTMGGRSQADIANRLLDKRQRGEKKDQIREALNFIDQWISYKGVWSEIKTRIAMYIVDDTDKAILGQWDLLVSLLDNQHELDGKLIIQPDLVHQWDYYSGIVFAIDIDSDIIARGGQYDELTRLLGSAEEIPAVGFAFDIDRMLDVSKIEEDKELEDIFIRFDDDNLTLALKLAKIIRQAGLKTILHPSPPSNAMSINCNRELIVTNRIKYTWEQIDSFIEDLKTQLYD